MKIRNEQVIDVQEWDRLVEDTYKRPYDLQQQNGCMERQRIYLTVPGKSFDFENTSLPEEVNGEEMGVSFAAWLERDPTKPLENQVYDFELRLWWERNFYPDLQMVANDLREKGSLPDGDYVIDIDW